MVKVVRDPNLDILASDIVLLIGRTQLLLPPTLNVAFRSFEPQIRELFPNQQLLKKKKIVATERTIFHWETALLLTVRPAGTYRDVGTGPHHILVFGLPFPKL